MKKFILILALIVVTQTGCKKEETAPVSQITTPPTPLTGWNLVYEEKVWGTFNCTMPNLCFYDIITDSLDFRNCDSIRILLCYKSYHNTALSVLKFPYYSELFSYSFPDSTTGRIDRYFYTDYNMKIIIDFGFEVENKFRIDTLKIFRKIRNTD